jgi:hypothetical protein
MEAPTKKRTISGRAVVVLLGVLLAVALLVNNYNHSQQDQNIDRGVDDAICAVDPAAC